MTGATSEQITAAPPRSGRPDLAPTHPLGPHTASTAAPHLSVKDTPLMSTRPTTDPGTDPAITLARQAMRGRRIVELQRQTDRLDARVTQLDRLAATVTEDRAHAVAAIDTALAELARLRKEGVR